MCGRYHVDEAVIRDIGRIIRDADRSAGWRTGDVYPAQTAPVLCREGGALGAAGMKWGLPGREKKLLINARAETALERPAFSRSVMHRRCIVPAGHFYEWNREKEKVSFRRQDGGTVYMAGFYERFEDGCRFIIVTTAANDSVRPVHHRMPLILEEGEIEPWIREDAMTGAFLGKTSPALERSQDYEQMSLFDF